MLGVSIATVVGALAVTELWARAYYKRRYLMPFRPRVIGEYPYSQFVERQDPPLHYRFKKNFSSPLVNINRFRCRGPQPAPDGEKRRLLLIGESQHFGVKLRREKNVWSIRLEQMLRKAGYHEWEVLNAGNPMYSSYQHQILWEQELHRVGPQILIVGIGGNDISQALMFGPRWSRETVWPWEFIMALERKSPWWNKLLGYSAIYYLLRRSATARRPFPVAEELPPLEAVLETISESYRAIVSSAKAMGIKVALSLYAPAYDFNSTPDDRRRLAAIQSNWESFIYERGEWEKRFLDYVYRTLAPELGAEAIDIRETFGAHPRRHELYLDVVHFNAEGMEVLARIFFERLKDLGWLE